MAYLVVYTDDATGARWEQSVQRTFDAAVVEVSKRLVDPLTRRRLPMYVNRAAQDLLARGVNGRGTWTVEWRTRIPGR